ncbi:MAG: aldolase/citrate lyase family protein [Gammaproteobacteria bacterium]|nr:aldolase/citrate lyase family protein [Gammaproteobacteria bacterium]
MYNTIKEKLENGKQVIGGTIDTPDPDIYRAMAGAGFDFLWIEMQHSPLTFQEVARMIWAGRDLPAVPFIRVPDATEGDIQKATDVGALGIIVPMVVSVEKVKAAVKFSNYPPDGVRSLGGGQYGALYGSGYRATANDNVMVVAMIESPAGVENADEIAGVPGVDVVFTAATDLYSFSGVAQGEPEYEAMVTRIHDATLGAGRALGGPVQWREREGFSFFQAPGATTLIGRGAKSLLSTEESVAPIEGSEK